MKKNRKKISLGTIFTLCLTVVVTVGCIFLFSKMLGENPEAMMSAQKMMSVIGSALQAPTPEAIPQSTVRTVTVTLAPTAELMPTPTPYLNAAPQNAPTVSVTADQREEYSFTLTAAGLAGFNSDISDSVYNKAAKTFDYAPVLSLIGQKIMADYNLVTLPNLLNTTDLKYADVNAPEAILDALLSGGFDDVLLNTEHIFDQGTEATEITARAIMARGFSCGGVNAGDALQNRMIYLNGAKIAMLAYTDTLTNKGNNALETQAGRNMLATFDLDHAKGMIQSAKAQGANCIIVMIHWGREDTTSITNAMREKAQALAEMGADIILGSHPSRVLPIEMIETRDKNGNDRQTLVAYSMGTLLTESRDGYDISGILLHLDVTCDTQGNVRFNSIQYTPTYIWRQSIEGKMQYRVVCSADLPPVGMDSKQIEVMGRALKRIQDTLADCPVFQRK